MNNLSATTNIILLVAILIQTSCVGFQKGNSPLNRYNKCQAPLSQECSHATDLWQNTINSVVWANYPSEIGYYQSVIWEDNFNNAWVIKGYEINITKKFILKLDYSQRLCVAAHELAHLKLGHYYSKIGLIIATNSFPKSEKTIRTEGLALNEQRAPILNGLIHGQRHKVLEEEANELALVFVNNLKSGDAMVELCKKAFIKWQA